MKIENCEMSKISTMLALILEMISVGTVCEKIIYPTILFIKIRTAICRLKKCKKSSEICEKFH